MLNFGSLHVQIRELDPIHPDVDLEFESDHNFRIKGQV